MALSGHLHSNSIVSWGSLGPIFNPLTQIIKRKRACDCDPDEKYQVTEKSSLEDLTMILK